MSQSLQVARSIKAVLKARDMTYRDLAQALGLSEITIKKSLSKGRFTLQRLEQVCDALEITLHELVAMSAPGGGGALQEQFTLEQEQALARDPRLLAYFYLLTTGMKPAAILQRYAYAREEAERHLLRLDKLRLIDLHPGNRVRLRASVNIQWLDPGPLRQRYLEELRRDFLDSDFKGPFEHARMVTGSVSASSIRVLAKRIEALFAEFRDLGRLDERAAGSEARTRISIHVAYRPWNLPILNRLRRA